MGDEREYEVILCPEGTTPETATDTRRFTYETTETDEDALRAEVINHIMSDRIDPDVFRPHWTLFEIRPVEESASSSGSATASPLDTFKTRLPVGRSPPFTPSGSQRIRSLDLYIVHRGVWSQRTLFPSPHTYSAFTNWLSQVQQTHSGIANSSVQQRDLHEAVVRTVAAVDPSFASSFDATKEQHHNKALQLVGDNESEFVAQLRKVHSNNPGQSNNSGQSNNWP